MSLLSFFKNRKIKKEIEAKNQLKTMELNRFSHQQEEVEKIIMEINLAMKENGLGRFKNIVRTVLTNKSKIQQKTREIKSKRLELETMEKKLTELDDAREKINLIEREIILTKEMIVLIKKARIIANDTVHIIEKEKEKVE